MENGFMEYAVVFKALGDETRLKILTVLTKGKTCACHLLKNFNITQPTLSYHMKQLTESGIVVAEKTGTWVHYSICKERVRFIKDFIDGREEAEDSADGCC